MVMTRARFRFATWLLLAIALLLPAAVSARVLGDAGVGYTAERALTVNGQRFDGILYAVPGFQRHEQLVGGMQQAAILDLGAGHGYFIVPAVRSFIDFPIDQALRELSAPDVLGAPAGTERVGGMVTTKYRVNHRGTDGTRIEGMVWLSANGIPMRADGAVIETNGRRTPVSWALSNVRVGPQDPGLFALPDGFYRLPASGLPGFLGGPRN